MGKPVKINDDLYERIKNMAEKQGKTIREIVEKAIGLYLQGSIVGKVDKEIKGIISKDIVVQFDSVCAKCKKPIKAGSVAHYIKVTYTDNTSRSWLFHLNCYVEEFDDSLAKAIIKREKIKSEIKSLEKYRNKLIEDITEKYELLKQKWDRIVYLTGANDLRDVNRNYEILMEIKDLLADIKYLMEEETEKIKEIKKPKKQRIER